MKKLLKEWNDLTLLRIFEIQVVNVETREDDYIIFDIKLDPNHKVLYAEHIGLSTEQEQSEYVATTSVDIDEDFSLTHHLNELYDACVCGIVGGDLWELS